MRYESPELAVWMGWSRNGVDGSLAWLDQDNGEVVAKNPDEEILQKMHQIAQVLDARVQGDDGEK